MRGKSRTEWQFVRGLHEALVSVTSIQKGCICVRVHSHMHTTVLVLRSKEWTLAFSPCRAGVWLRVPMHWASLASASHLTLDTLGSQWHTTTTGFSHGSWGRKCGLSRSHNWHFHGLSRLPSPTHPQINQNNK